MVMVYLIGLVVAAVVEGAFCALHGQSPDVGSMVSAVLWPVTLALIVGIGLATVLTWLKRRA